MCFSAAASSENDHGSMNLTSNTAPLPSTMPSRVAAIQRSTGWRTQAWTSLTTCPVVRSYQCRLRCSVAASAEVAEEGISLTAANNLAIRGALEAAGVDFIDENGGGPGVRLRKSSQEKSRK